MNYILLEFANSITPVGRTDDPAFFKALYRGQIEWITQWDGSRALVTDGRMCITDVEIIEKDGKEESAKTPSDTGKKKASAPGSTSLESAEESPPDHIPSQNKMLPPEEPEDGPVPTR